MNKINRLLNSKTSGFTLIEVLVALLILAVGLLGIAALQFKGLRYSNDSFMRSQISFLAYDIADRMRSNAAMADDYLGDYAVPATPVDTCNHTIGLETAANIANDLECWRTAVDNSLPPGSTANITVAGSLYSVILTWTDREGSAHNVNYSFQP